MSAAWLSYQEAFDRMARHLLLQGECSKRSFQRRPICAYRGNRGRRCAVGALISDDAYSVKLESLSLQHGDVKVALEKSGVLCDGRMNRLLDRMQEVHDENPPYQWASMMRDVAHLFELSDAVVREVEESESSKVGGFPV